MSTAVSVMRWLSSDHMSFRIEPSGPGMPTFICWVRARRAPSRKGLKIKRVFTTAGVHPYDELTWERRDVVQQNWKTGLTIFRPTDGLDEGPVILQKETDVSDNDTLGTVYFDRLFPMGVKAMLEEVLSSPLVPRVAALIAKRLGRPLEPFDVWYAGFKPRGAHSEEELDKITKWRGPAIFIAEFARLALHTARASGNASCTAFPSAGRSGCARYDPVHR